MELSQIEQQLMSEVKLEQLQAKIFLLITTGGKMNDLMISQKLEIPISQVLENCKELVEKGGLIELPNNEFEAMHPRFTAVNMYRKMCEREKIEFKRNKIVDNIGVVLERFYDAARTK